MKILHKMDDYGTHLFHKFLFTMYRIVPEAVPTLIPWSEHWKGFIDSLDIRDSNELHTHILYKLKP